MMATVESSSDSTEINCVEQPDSSKSKYHYGNRPVFLNLSLQQLQESRDHKTRPIMSPSDGSKLPWNSGYAETINAGKSRHRNEDQASYSYEVIRHKHWEQPPNEINVPVWFFGLFDGHGGGGASAYSASICHQHVMTNLNSIPHFLPSRGYCIQPERDAAIGYISPPIHLRDLIRGALEKAFFAVDDEIEKNRAIVDIVGGCTALVSVFLDRTLYVANAGDSRAIVLRDGQIVEMSMDFSPETDRQRVQSIAKWQSHLLGESFGRLQFQRRIMGEDIGEAVLYRDYYMTGWSYKMIDEWDAKKIPMIRGQGKTARLLATIGTTRGFGDHDLKTSQGLDIKPFLTPMPEVRSYDLSDYGSLSHDDVLIVASDGLWERLENEEVRHLVQNLFHQLPTDDSNRYMKAASHLILAARGKWTDYAWKTERDESASYDDITCFVIPLKRAAQDMSFHTFQRQASSSPKTDELTTDRGSDSPAVSEKKVGKIGHH